MKKNLVLILVLVLESKGSLLSATVSTVREFKREKLRVIYGRDHRLPSSLGFCHSYWNCEDVSRFCQQQMDSLLSNSIDLKSHIFVTLFGPQEQQNLSVRCRASLNTDRSRSLLWIKDCLCQPNRNYRNQILVLTSHVLFQELEE